MEFRMPDFFWWTDVYSQWRDKRKSSWQKRFAFLPVKLGTANNKRKTAQYVWLGFYYIKGKKYERPGQIINGHWDFGFTYWEWHTVRTQKERTLN